jgi:hypothetical protein
MLPYWLSIHDNGSAAFAGRTDLHRCSRCGELLSKWSEPLTGLVLRTRRRLDLSCTYDGIRIASTAFKDVYDENRMIGLLFSRLPDDPRYLSVIANIVAPFDWQRRQTLFDNQCPVCGRYKSVAGATPVFLREGVVVPENGFARTDTEFGSGDEKHPVWLCGPSARAVLANSKLKGFEVV